MIRQQLFAVGMALTLMALGACAMGGGENEQYLDLFENFWSQNRQGQLFNLEVASVADGPAGWKQVTINYTHGIGENYPSQEDQAAMLVSPDGKSIKKCVYDTASGNCLGDAKPDWSILP